MIYPDRAKGVTLVTDNNHMRHSFHHAPTATEGRQVAMDAFRAKRGDRYIKSRYLRK